MSTYSLGTSASRTDPVRVLEEMKRLAVEQLGGLPGGLYQPVEQALLAMGPESFSDQGALAMLRQHSASHVMRYRQLIAQGFDNFRTPPQRAKTELGLIEENVLDMHLSAQRLTEILDSRYEQALDLMVGRLQGLSAALHVPEGPNPLAPTRLTELFLQLYGEAELSKTLGALLLRQYQQHLVRVLEGLYPRINAMLAAAGYSKVEAARRVTPMSSARSPLDDLVEHRVQSSVEAPMVGIEPEHAPAESLSSSYWSRGGAATGDFGQGGSSLQGPSGPRFSVELSTLREQLHAWRDEMRQSQDYTRVPLRNTRMGTPGMAPMRQLQHQELTSIASLLQSEPPDLYARALAVSGRLGDTIRDHLAEGARRLGMRPDQLGLGVEEEDSIDMVALLFESLFRTHALHERARRLYARLVLPYVKVALNDDSMFVNHQHPARLLLDALTEACEDNNAATPQDRELLERAAAVAQRVVADYNEDLAVFETAHAELEELLKQQRRRIELQEQRAAKATFGRERLSEARSKADSLLKTRLGHPPVTQAVGDFLSTPWRHHLVQTLLREGEDSTRYSDAVRLGDALVEADRLAQIAKGQSLADHLLRLEPSIVQCLGSSGLDDTAATHGMATLVRGLANPDISRSLQPMPAPVRDEVEEDSRLRLAGGTDTLDFDPALAADLRMLRVGDWLRMTEPQGETIAVKVAWISPLTSRLLLVNRRGMRVLVASTEEMAVLVGDGRLALDAECSPFDAAMRQMQQQLDKVVGLH